MHEVTLPFMAYVCAQVWNLRAPVTLRSLTASQVRFALSSDEVFGQNIERSFDIYAFYRNILKTLKEEELADDVEVIRSRWNE